jgi:exonuclease VII small subunit
MSKSALEDFNESVQKLEDAWAVCEASLNDHCNRIEKAKASLERVLDAARQAVNDCNDLNNLQPPEVE